MDQNFQLQVPPPLVADDESSYAVGEAYLNGVCAGLSFRSLLTYGTTATTFQPPPEAPISPLKMPKIEPLSAVGDGYSTPATLRYNFFSDAASSSSFQLPSLLSLELPQNPCAAADSSRFETGKPPQRRRRQQQKLSDKTRSLQKLLPRDEKMDMATVLEEAYKYIRFLQAQVSVLQSMPSESVAGGGVTPTTAIAGADLTRLNRQQLLEVVVNSPMAQTHLCSKGCCIYSVEQLIMLKKNAERKQALYQQMLLDSPNPNPFL